MNEPLRLSLLQLRSHLNLAARHLTAAEAQIKLAEERLTALLLPPEPEK